MSKKTPSNSLISAFLSIVFLLPPLILSYLLMRAANRNTTSSHQTKVDIFTDYFPSWLGNFNVLMAISIILCIVSISLASKSFRKNLLWERILMMIVTMVAIVIILYNIAQWVQ